MSYIMDRDVYKIWRTIKIEDKMEILLGHYKLVPYDKFLIN